MNNPETYHGGEHKTDAISEAAAEQQERLEKLEVAPHSPEKAAEQVDSRRNEVKEVFAQEAGKEHKQGGEPGFSRAVHHVTQSEKKQAYQQTMQRIRVEMSAPAQAFSKFIHNVTVEKASNALSTTIARPNAMLSGSVTALVLVSALYVLAKVLGYPLSGFETIGAFLIGWLIGLGYDYVRTLATGQTN